MTVKNEQEFLLDAARLLLGRGKTQRQIATELKLSLGKTNQIIQIIKSEAKEKIQKYVNVELPSAYENTLNGINQILSTLWDSIDKANTEKDKYQALALCMQAYSLRLELLSSAEPLKHVVSFVDSHTLDSKDRGLIQQIDDPLIGDQAEDDNETTAEH